MRIDSAMPPHFLVEDILLACLQLYTVHNIHTKWKVKYVGKLGPCVKFKYNFGQAFCNHCILSM